MRRTSFRIGLALGVLAGAARFCLAQQALENLERQLPLPKAGSQVGAPKGAVPKDAVPNDAVPGDRGATSPAVEEPGYLGIVADESGDRGVRLIDVLPGGPADAAGMRVGDVLTSVDGAAVNSLDELGGLLTRRVAGEKLAMVVIRGVDGLRFDVALGKRPPPEQRRYPNFGRITGDNGEPLVVEPPTNTLPPAPGSIVDPADTLPAPQEPSFANDPGPAPGAVAEAGGRPRSGLLGVRVVRITPELQLAMNLPEPRGALVVEVRPDSPARKAGLPVDAVIVAANGRRIEGPDELADIVSRIGGGGSLRVTYYRYGQSFERLVELEAPPEGATILAPPAAAPPVFPSPVSPSTVSPSPGPTLGPPPSSFPAPKSVAEENERLRARIAELEALLKATQGEAPSTSSGQAKPK